MSIYIHTHTHSHTHTHTHTHARARAHSDGLILALYCVRRRYVVESAFRRIDTDRDGRVGYREFANMMRMVLE